MGIADPTHDRISNIVRSANGKHQYPKIDRTPLWQVAYPFIKNMMNVSDHICGGYMANEIKTTNNSVHFGTS